MQKKKNKSSNFITKTLVGAIWCLNVTVLFTFAKPYLNFVCHETCPLCSNTLVPSFLFLQMACFVLSDGTC